MDPLAMTDIKDQRAMIFAFDAIVVLGLDFACACHN
jgi:hypothetical protein